MQLEDAGIGARRAVIAARLAQGPTPLSGTAVYREIAATLFLSQKTIESHLRNIFVALQVRSRVELTRLVPHDEEHQDAGEPAAR